MGFSAKDVADLREKTGCGMMDCKKALDEAQGDQKRAVELLREKGLSAAEKKASRIAAEGLIATFVEPEISVGAIIEVNSETDFVAKNAEFVKFVNECARIVAKDNPADLSGLMACNLGTTSIEDALKEKILVIGENLKIRRFARLEGVLHSYLHGEGKIGVLVKFSVDAETSHSEEFQTMAHDVALQIAAANPGYLNRESVSKDVLESERQILMAQAMNEGKPQNIAEKMVAGRISKFYKENCLMDQEFIKEPGISLADYVDSVAKKLQKEIGILEFVRFERGEGIEKKTDNFAEEVAGMVK